MATPADPFWAAPALLAAFIASLCFVGKTQPSCFYGFVRQGGIVGIGLQSYTRVYAPETLRIRFNGN